MAAETAIFAGELVGLAVGADVTWAAALEVVAADVVWVVVLEVVVADVPWIVALELAGAGVPWTAELVLAAVGRLVGFDRAERASFPAGS